MQRYEQDDSTSNKTDSNGDFHGVHDDMGDDAYKYILATLVATYPFCY